MNDRACPLEPAFTDTRHLWILAAVLAFLLITVWAEPPGSPLVDHDETRYAEIAREMLTRGDYVVPHLNGVVWYEKPPMLFWAGAVSMRVFGATPWAARLPIRIASLGTICVLFIWVASESDRRRGLLAAILAVGTPLGWGVSRLVLTDGLLTFFLTSATIGGYAAVRQPDARARTLLALGAGVAAGCAFLTKGLIGFLFPTLILGIWALMAGRGRSFGGMLPLSGAGALAVAAPWLVLVAHKSPDYLRFFIVREHFQRYTSTIHDRQQPVFFIAAVFLLALMPVVATFLSLVLRRGKRLSEGERMLLIWIASIVLFFSFSKSQLVAYAAPAVPAAAAFIALRFARSSRRSTEWIAQASLMTVVTLSVFVRTQPASLLLEPAVRSLAIAAATALVASAWIAAWVARRDEWRAMAWTFSGLAMLYGAVVIGWPVSGRAREMVILRETIARQRRAGAGEIVSYRTFLKGLPWLLKSPVPFVDAGGELAEGTKAIRSSDDPIAWTEARFWKRWEDDRPLLALVRETDLAAFERRGGGVPFIIARARRHLLVSNSTPLSYPSSDPWTSTALYWSHAQPHTTPVPLASVPPRVVAGARRELEGRSIVRSFVERTKRGYAYEFASGGSLPRIVEVEPSGEATYTEEMVREAELPHDVLETFKRVSPKSTVVFLTRERPLNGEPDRYQMYIAGQRGLREMGIDESAYSRE